MLSGSPKPFVSFTPLVARFAFTAWFVSTTAAVTLLVVLGSRGSGFAADPFGAVGAPEARGCPSLSRSALIQLMLSSRKCWKSV